MGIPLAALAVQQPPSALDQAGKLIALQGGAQRVQGEQLQNQMQRQQLQDSQLFMESLRKNNGDWDSALEDASRNGMSGQGYMQYGQQILVHKQAVQKLTTDQLDNQSKIYDSLDGQLQGFKALSPQDQATQWPTIRQKVAQQAPQLANQLPQNPPTSAQLDAFDAMLLGGKTSSANELKKREVTAQETTAGARAKEAELHGQEFAGKL